MNNHDIHIIGKQAPYKGKEADLQKAVAKYLDLKKVLWFHPPNGGFRNIREAANLKRQGVQAGVSDVIILEPRSKWHGLIIELKVKGGKPTDKQIAFLTRAKERNYQTVICYNLQDAISTIEFYLSL